ncbi:Hypothetical protein I596_682 [Dokdonella koreensis DS-123]|uniref:Uncharacterized protein n=1 Tax=Dokdonella koreensis DS-123 TaxID=1300342 RepID=A0A167GM37_9GAMM|nr:Hypothetical protein I596_682 [Dokdonella koreensis DS-123]
MGRHAGSSGWRRPKRGRARRGGARSGRARAGPRLLHAGLPCSGRNAERS